MCTLTALVISKYRVLVIKVISFDIVEGIADNFEKSIDRGIVHTFQAQNVITLYHYFFIIFILMICHH